MPSTRGNSGAILGQLLTGVAMDIGDRVTVAPGQLALAVRAGARAAREAVSEPRAGTMLSVISAFAEALEQREEVHDIRAWFAQTLAVARKAGFSTSSDRVQVTPMAQSA